MGGIAQRARLDMDAERRIRPQPIITETFEGLRLYKGQLTAVVTKPTLEECRDAMAQRTPHKLQFAVRRTDLTSGQVILFVYQVRQKAPRHVVRDHVPQRVCDQYAELLTEIELVEASYPDELARVVGLPLGASRPVANEVQSHD